jgi:hypothetical protein
MHIFHIHRRLVGLVPVLSLLDQSTLEVFGAFGTLCILEARRNLLQVVFDYPSQRFSRDCIIEGRVWIIAKIVNDADF